MNKQEAQILLRERLAEYRWLSYADLAARVGADEKGGRVLVMGCIDDGGWRAFFPLCESFVVAPGGTALGERCL